MKKVIKKTKKNVIKKKIIVGVVGMAVILGVAVAFIFSNRNKESDTVQKLESNQELVYGKITEINGNEITYTVCTISDGTIQNTEGSEDTKADVNVRESGEKSTRRNVDAEVSEGGEMSERPDASIEDSEGGEIRERPDASIEDSEGGEIRERPDASIEDSEGGEIRERPDASIEDSEGGEIRERPDASIEDSESGEMPESVDAGVDGEESEFGAREITEKSGEETDGLGGSSATSTISYFETDETITTLISVGTTVTTKLGTITTFSRLTAGDVIEIVLEKQSDGSLVIVSIEIVE